MPLSPLAENRLEPALRNNVYHMPLDGWRLACGGCDLRARPLLRHLRYGRRA